MDRDLSLLRLKTLSVYRSVAQKYKIPQHCFHRFSTPSSANCSGGYFASAQAAHNLQVQPSIKRGQLDERVCMALAATEKHQQGFNGGKAYITISYTASLSVRECLSESHFLCGIIAGGIRPENLTDYSRQDLPRSGIFIRTPIV